MRAKLGNAFFLLSFAVVGVVAPSAAEAQTYDFATCDPAVTAATACSATVTSCCTQTTTAASAFLQNGTDYALVIPMDNCHQDGSGDDGLVNNYPGFSASSRWCRMPTDTGASNGVMKVYGLAYRLMQNGIPIYWVVNPSKDPPALGCSLPGACKQIATDVDMWIMDAAATTPPAANASLVGPQIGTAVKRWTATSAGVFAADAAWVYDRKGFPVRGGAFVIAASNRAQFNKFIRKQAPFAAMGLATRSCGNGANCQDFSGIDFFEVQPTGSIGWTNFVTNPTGSPGATGWQAGKLPIAVKLSYTPPRVAERPGPPGVSKKWLEVANLSDTATNTAVCPTGTFVPSDAVLCDLSVADITANKLVSGNFGWLWLDHFNPGCGAEMTAINTFLTQQSGIRAAGNVMGIADGSQAEECANQQLLGKRQVAAGLGIASGSTPSNMIIKYPQNLMNQWGNAQLDVANGLGGSGFQFAGSGYGYHPNFAGPNPNSLHRLVTVDSNAGNTYCTNNKTAAGCDSGTTGTAETKDIAMYGRYLNDPNNGLVFYVPGTQIQNKPTELRMVLDSLIALPVGTVPVTTGSTTEVSRNTPIAMLSGAIVQGVYEVVSPTPAVTTFSLNSDSGTFRFPYFKGHLRARTGLTSTGSYSSGTLVFDAASGIPSTATTYTGCTPFTSSCRTIFTTTDATRTTSGIVRRLFNASNSSTIGPIMASNLTTANQQLLMQRVIAGDDSATAGTFVAKLGGVDRSTVAVIESSTFVNSTRPTMAYFGATDGMLHAVCATTGGNCAAVGQELWAYLPRKVLPLVRLNLGRVDGSPNVVDAFGDFYGTGKKSWRTILTFATGNGNATAQDRVPATYALDISNPFDPKILWEHSIADTSALAALEPGQALNVSQGRVLVSAVPRNLTFVQSNNLGSAGSGSVVEAIDTETGDILWKRNGYAYPAPRTAGNNVVPSSGVPGGVVPVDKTGNGYVTDLVFATLYGDVWQVDPATGASRYKAGSPLADVPMFRFSTDFQPIGGTPSIYSDGNQQYVIVATGGFPDPSDTHWACNNADITTCTTLPHVLRISLNPAGSTFPINESATASVVNKTLVATQRAFGSVSVIGDALYVVVDSSDVNGAAYGTTGSDTGQVLKLALTNLATASTTATRSGSGSVTKAGLKVYAAGQDVGTAPTGTGTSVDSGTTLKITRELWLRSE